MLEKESSQAPSEEPVSLWCCRTPSSIPVVARVSHLVEVQVSGTVLDPGPAPVAMDPQGAVPRMGELSTSSPWTGEINVLCNRIEHNEVKVYQGTKQPCLDVPDVLCLYESWNTLLYKLS